MLEKEEKVTEFGNYSYIKYTYQSEDQAVKTRWINRILGQGAAPVSDLYHDITLGHGVEKNKRGP